MPAKIHAKLYQSRARDYSFCLANAGRALRSPDFVGLPPEHPGRVNVVARVPGSRHEGVLVSFNQARTGAGRYEVVTIHPIALSKIQNRVAAGSLNPVRK